MSETLSATLEMIFRCIHCNYPRQYGTAANYKDRPDNPNPVIQCACCHRAVEHRFDRVEPRRDSRERKIVAEMRVSPFFR